MNRQTTHTFLGSLSPPSPWINTTASQVLSWAPLLVLASWINRLKEHLLKQVFLHCIPKGHSSAKNGAQDGYKVLSPEEISHEFSYGSQLNAGLLTTAPRSERWVPDPPIFLLDDAWGQELHTLHAFILWAQHSGPCYMLHVCLHKRWKNLIFSCLSL